MAKLHLARAPPQALLDANSLLRDIFERVYGLIYTYNGQLYILIAPDILQANNPEALRTLIHEIVEFHRRLQGLSIEEAHQEALNAEEKIPTTYTYEATLTGSVVDVRINEPTVPEVEQEAERAAFYNGLLSGTYTVRATNDQGASINILDIVPATERRIAYLPDGRIDQNNGIAKYVRLEFGSIHFIIDLSNLPAGTYV
jgi:hypothetical protein